MSIQINGNNIDAVYYGDSQIGEIYYGAQLVYSSVVKLIINTTPADATVTFSTGEISGNQTVVKKGTVVTYTVSKNGYYSTSGTVTVNSNQTLNVSLEQKYYNDGQIMYESASGGASTTLNLQTSGRYQVICIGGGGGASQYHSNFRNSMSSGGSGAGFNCVFQLAKGNYAIQVGNAGAGVYKENSGVPGKAADGGNSCFGNSYAYGGIGGHTAAGAVLTAGAGGATPKLSYSVISSTLNQAGNQGMTSTTRYTPAPGGASLYGSYGKGGDAVTDASKVNGTAGYVKVIFLGK